MNLPQIDLRQLRYFVAVAEELHFGRAAKRLNIAQPPLSQQIKQLERVVGAPLFLRTSRKTELTPTGAVLLKHARLVLQEADRALAVAKGAARGEIDALSVGFTDSAALSVLPSLVRQFRAEHPDVRLDLVEGSTHGQLVALERSLMDVVLVRGPVRRPAFRTETLLTEEFVVAVPSDHVLSEQRAVALADLRTETFVLFPRHLAPEFHDEIIGMCRAAGFSPEVRSEAAEYQTMLSLVAAGVGISIVPASVRNLPRSGVRFVELTGARGEATIVLAYRADRASTTLQNFIAVACSA